MGKQRSIASLSQSPDFLYFDKIGKWGVVGTGTTVLTEEKGQMS